MDQLEILQYILDNIDDWDTSDEDPWDRENGYELTISSLPSNAGVYAFKSLEEHDIYYIGKAEKDLEGRLEGKLKADLKEKRVRNEWIDGELIHDYPYLPRYVKEQTRVYTISPPSEIEPSDLEDILLAAHIIKYGNRPMSNRKGGGALSKSKDPEIIELLEKIADQLLEIL